MMLRKRRWILIGALLLGGAAGAANREIQCKKTCDTIGKSCIESCKEGVRKKAPGTVQYCAPKCNEIKDKCDKDCENNDKKKH